MADKKCLYDSYSNLSTWTNTDELVSPEEAFKAVIGATPLPDDLSEKSLWALKPMKQHLARVDVAADLLKQLESEIRQFKKDDNYNVNLLHPCSRVLGFPVCSTKRLWVWALQTHNIYIDVWGEIKESEMITALQIFEELNEDQ